MIAIGARKHMKLSTTTFSVKAAQTLREAEPPTVHLHDMTMQVAGNIVEVIEEELDEGAEGQ